LNSSTRPTATSPGTCLGASAPAANGTAVILQPCGIDSQTLWIPLDSDNSGVFWPLINGSDTVVNTPYVLTAGPVGTSLTTSGLNTVGGAVSPAQMWQSVFGVL
jgi:hypothetical protein